MTVTQARIELAAAVTAAGLECSPYAPDAPNPSPVQAFVDALSIDFAQGSGFSFCYSGMARATIIACGQRHDKAASTLTLENLIPATIQSLERIEGLSVTGVQSGTVSITGNELPSVLYTCEFGISTGGGP